MRPAPTVTCLDQSQVPLLKKAKSMNKKLIGSASAVAVAVVLYACGGSGNSNPSVDVSKGTVLLNANVVNTRDGSVSGGMSIVIDGGKIQQIIPGGTNVTVSGSGQAVDATGKFVVPGYLDMHTHSMDAVDQQPTNWPLQIANGITGIREMRGSAEAVQRARKLNADSAAGLVDAPEVLLIPGEIIGQIPAPATAAIATQAGPAIAEVQKQKAYGAGFIKMFNVNREASLAILGETKKQGFTAIGHLSPALSAVESSNAGWGSIEHLGSGIGILLDCAGEEAAVRAALLRGEGGVTPPLPPTWTASVQSAPFWQRVLASYDNAKCQSVAQTFAKNGTWNAPTLIRLRTQHFVTDPLFRNDPNLIYVSRATRAAWEAAAVTRSTFPATAQTTFQQYYGQQLVLTKLMKQNGVKMLTGSDTSTGAPFVIPGFSLHQEFRELASAGLSPLEILQMTTLNGAEYMGRQSTMGTVDIGKNADLVVLDANPVADVANMSKIAAVVLKGKYFSKASLDKQKADVAAAYASVTIQTVAASVEPAHID